MNFSQPLHTCHQCITGKPFVRFEQLERLPAGIVKQLEAVLTDDQISAEKTRLVVKLFQTESMEPFSVLVLRSAEAADGKLLAKVNLWLIPELILRRDEATLGDLEHALTAGLAPVPERSERSELSGRSERSEQMEQPERSERPERPERSERAAARRRSSVRGDGASRAFFTQYLLHTEGLMARILLQLLVGPPPPSVSAQAARSPDMSDAELRARGEFFLTLLPDQASVLPLLMRLNALLIAFFFFLQLNSNPSRA